MANLHHPMLFYALVMLIAGIGIPIGATLNALLGEKLHSPILAAAVFFAIAFISHLCLFRWAVYLILRTEYYLGGSCFWGR